MHHDQMGIGVDRLVFEIDHSTGAASEAAESRARAGPQARPPGEGQQGPVGQQPAPEAAREGGGRGEGAAVGEPGQPERRPERSPAAAEDRAGDGLEADLGLWSHKQTAGKRSSVKF